MQRGRKCQRHRAIVEGHIGGVFRTEVDPRQGASDLVSRVRPRFQAVVVHRVAHVFADRRDEVGIGVVVNVPQWHGHGQVANQVGRGAQAQATG